MASSRVQSVGSRDGPPSFTFTFTFSLSLSLSLSLSPFWIFSMAEGDGSSLLGNALPDLRSAGRSLQKTPLSSSWSQCTTRFGERGDRLDSIYHGKYNHCKNNLNENGEIPLIFSLEIPVDCKERDPHARWPERAWRRRHGEIFRSS